MGRVGRFGGVVTTGWGVGIRCRWGECRKRSCPSWIERKLLDVNERCNPEWREINRLKVDFLFSCVRCFLNYCFMFIFNGSVYGEWGR